MSEENFTLNEQTLLNHIYNYGNTTAFPKWKNTLHAIYNKRRTIDIPTPDSKPYILVG